GWWVAGRASDYGFPGPRRRLQVQQRTREAVVRCAASHPPSSPPRSAAIRVCRAASASGCPRQSSAILGRGSRPWSILERWEPEAALEGLVALAGCQAARRAVRELGWTPWRSSRLPNSVVEPG